MYKDKFGHRITDNAPYTAQDGTRYPGDYPKGEIPGLVKDGDDPIETPPPSEVEVRLAALETKTGITQEDKEQALTAIMSAEQIKGEK